MRRENHHIIQNVLEGTVTREEFDAFQQRLRSDPALEKLYKEYSLLHHTLHEEFEHETPTTPSAAAGRKISGIPLGWLVLGLITIATCLWWFKPWKRNMVEDDIAVLTFSLDAIWQIKGKTHPIGSASGVAQNAELSIQQGRMRIFANPSAYAVVEGPAKIGFPSPGVLHLQLGKVFFNTSGSHGDLMVTTPGFTVSGQGAKYGITIAPSGRGELQVIEGTVQLNLGNPLIFTTASPGETLRISDGVSSRHPVADPNLYATSLGRFRKVIAGPFDNSQWRIDYGKPTFSQYRIEGTNYAAFQRLPEPVPTSGNTVVLATLEVGKPPDGIFHTDGWAGMSFYNHGAEIVFFGDSFGPVPTWSLDVKQRVPVIHPQDPVAGPRIVTLRYDSRSGCVSLHDGGIPLKPPFCTGRLPAGSCFDEIRIGASSGAALTVNSLTIRVGGK
jgi:hypothetical protein